MVLDRPPSLALDRCPDCGYSLMGLPDHGRCPECGHLYEPTDIVLYGWAQGPHVNGANERGGFVVRKNRIRYRVAELLPIVIIAMIVSHDRRMAAAILIVGGAAVVLNWYRRATYIRDAPRPVQ